MVDELYKPNIRYLKGKKKKKEKIKNRIYDKKIIIKLTMLLPDEATRLIHRITTCAALESKPVVGSSRKSIAGFAASSTAIDNLFFCSKLIPPDN